MAVPKKRHSKSKVGRRRMHIFLKKPNFVVCSKCGEEITPHNICPFCGYYRNKKMIDVLTKKDKKERKKKEKELKIKEESKKEKKPLSFEDLSKK